MERLRQVLENREENYILPFFWQHGEDEETLREYMRAIFDANIREVCLESRPHPDFAGPRWWQDLDVILDEAKKLGMKIWILDDSHFPTGFANGAVKKAPNELKHRYLVSRTLEMAGPVKQAEFTVSDYMRPVPPPPWIPQPPGDGDDDCADDELLNIYACPVLKDGVLGEPMILEADMEKDTVVFDLPEGFFRIYVSYFTRNARGRNDYINFLDKDSCRLLIDAVYEPHYRRYKAYFGTIIRGFFSDEPPIGNTEGYTPVGPIGTAGQNLPWARACPALLTAEFGSEEWIRYIPYLWADAGDKEMQAKIRNAYMDMVSGLVAECFSKQLGNWCSSHGVEYIGHMLEDCDMHLGMGASMGHFFRGLSGQHMAGVDNIGGQVNIMAHHVPRHDHPAARDEAGFYQYMIGKMASSHAYIDPGKKGRSLCENFGAYGWHSGPKEQKYMLDHFMVRGVNHFVPHAFSPAPFPDPDCPPHFYAHGENPTYRAFGDLMAYTNRVCALISDGSPCPDAALLYNAESWWAGNADSQIPVCRSLGESQIDFHILPQDVFDHDEYPCTYDGSVLTVNGIPYRLLIVTGCDFVGKTAAVMIERMIRDSFPVIFTNRTPKGFAGGDLKENQAFGRLCREAICVPEDNIGAFLKEKRRDGSFRPQIRLEPENQRLSASHYRLEGTDEFLILNEMSETVFRGNAELKASGVPIRYIPWENRLEQVSFEPSEGGLKIDLDMDPLELAVILVFPEGSEIPDLVPDARLDKDAEQDGSDRGIEIKSFTAGLVGSVEYLNTLKEAGLPMHGADASVVPDTVFSLEAPFTGVQREYPDFSGYIIYETPVNLEKDTEYILLIDDVGETAEAFLNGKSLGVRVQAPYRFTIPASIVREESVLRIEAATLADRKAKKTRPDSMRSMSADRPFTPSGIVGNVRIIKNESFSK